jgi:hypothetical protein
LTGFLAEPSANLHVTKSVTVHGSRDEQLEQAAALARSLQAALG